MVTSPQSTVKAQRIEMVGRAPELKRLATHLANPVSRRYIYYIGDGGLGKTRLLEELLRRVDAAGAGYRHSGIIDLYHTDTHSNSDVERIIAQRLDPEGRYFAEYRAARAHYEKQRYYGAPSEQLERLRARLIELFIKQFNNMAKDHHKLVLCFDTLELLQHESSQVEQKAGLDTVDTRLKPWFLQVLPELHNVLVVFAGRPKQAAPEDDFDPQAKLEDQFLDAFGGDLDIVTLSPLTEEETADFIHNLNADDVLGGEQLHAVYQLTGGRPIYVYLLAFAGSQAPDPDLVRKLIGAGDDSRRAGLDSETARKEFENRLLETIFNSGAILGGYIGEIALFAKGVDAKIVDQVMGMTRTEAEMLIQQLRDLAFVKEFGPPPEMDAGAEDPVTPYHIRRIFLHDEMYRNMNSEVIKNLKARQKRAASNVISAYYRPGIDDLQEELAAALGPQRKAPEIVVRLRERLQKLQVEQLYYLLVRDPVAGYQEYASLTDQANRARYVGFAMRLLDEFLRFYQHPDHRKQFENAGLSSAQVARESALLWVERFFWWGQYRRAIDYGQELLEDLSREGDASPTDLAARVNVLALVLRASILLDAATPQLFETACRTLQEYKALNARDQSGALPEARLAASVGWYLDERDDLDAAREYYNQAEAAFRALGCCRDELAMLLNNLAWLNARQGATTVARRLAYEALAINDELQLPYSKGLTLTTIATIENNEGHWHYAIERANEAWSIFNQLEDAHGKTLALLARGQARRKLAKDDIQKPRDIEKARERLLEAEQDLTDAVALMESLAKDAGDKASQNKQFPILHSKLGKVYRELIRVDDLLDARMDRIEHQSASKEEFNKALTQEGYGALDRAGIRVDYAEMLLVSGLPKEARKQLEAFGREWTEVYKQPAVDDAQAIRNVAPQYLRPLGKAERLEGQIALLADDYEAALHKFARAFACFQLFSPTAREGDTILEIVYPKLRPLPAAQRRALLAQLKEIKDTSGIGNLMEAFYTDMQRLLGV